jgi:hypothetical protein
MEGKNLVRPAGGLIQDVIPASTKRERQIILVLLYVLLLAGGLWHALNVLMD